MYNCLQIQSPCKGELFNFACYHWFMSIPSPWVILWTNLSQSLFPKWSFLELSHPFNYVVYSCFCTITEEFSFDRDRMTHKTKNIHFLTLYRKSLPNIASWLEHGKARFLGLNLHFLYPVPEISHVNCSLWSHNIAQGLCPYFYNIFPAKHSSTKIIIINSGLNFL